MSTTTTQSTHEDFIQRVRDLVVTGADLTEDEASKLRHTKLIYGLGNGSYRGITAYNAWKNGIGNVDVVEIAASAEESWIQLAGTTIHELAHVLGGWEAGHSNKWKTHAFRLGFTRKPEAAGQVYHLVMFKRDLRVAIYHMARSLADGNPALWSSLGLGGPIPKIQPRPCSAGTGTRGGSSRGKGSGSRLRLWKCGCPKPVKVRVASDNFDATCNVCGYDFIQKS